MQAERLVASKPVQLRTLTVVLTERRDVLDSEWKTLLPEWVNACRDRDRTVAARAKQWLRSAQDQPLIDAVCRHAWQTGDVDSTSAAVESGYVPSDGVENALYFFSVELWDKFEHADPNLLHLTAAYETLTDAVKKRFREIALRTSRLDLVVAMTKNFNSEAIKKLSDDEFEVAFQVLLKNSEWSRLKRIAAEIPERYNDSMWNRILESGKQVPEQLWQLAQASPIGISLKCLQALKRQNWKPQAAEQLRAAESLFALIDCDVAVNLKPLLLRHLKTTVNPPAGQSVQSVQPNSSSVSDVVFQHQSYAVRFKTPSSWRYSYVLPGSSNARLNLWRTDKPSGSYSSAYGSVSCATAYPDILLDRSPFSISVDELQTQSTVLDEYSTDADRRFAECVLAVIHGAS